MSSSKARPPSAQCYIIRLSVTALVLCASSACHLFFVHVSLRGFWVAFSRRSLGARAIERECLLLWRQAQMLCIIAGMDQKDSTTAVVCLWLVLLVSRCASLRCPQA